MSETTTETPEAVSETSADTEAPTATVDNTEDPAGAEALGEPGKKALDAMKAAKKEAEAKAREAETRAAELEAKLNGKEAEFKAAQEAQRVKDEALAAANARIVKAEIRAAAAGKLSDPGDALRFLDVSSFEVSDDGSVDAAAIADAINDLVTNKPYLTAQGGRKFQGSADGGVRNDATGPTQLTRADMARMSPEQIDQAYREGRFADLLTNP